MIKVQKNSILCFLISSLSILLFPFFAPASHSSVFLPILSFLLLSSILRVASSGCEIHLRLLPMVSQWLALLWLFLLVSANTETFSFQVPNYYDIPPHHSPYTSHKLLAINDSTLVMYEYPVLNVSHYDLQNTVVRLPYDFASKPRQQLLVKLNNYCNRTFDANDVINVKLCWPAILPVNFDLEHRFVRAHDVGLAAEGLENDTLDIYVVVDYQADFYAVREPLPSTIEFNLVISKLPNKLPIPIELYGFIVYLVDVCIVVVALHLYVMEGIKKAFF